MLIIGVRVDPRATRYAILDVSGSEPSFKNKNGETRLTYPQNLTSITDKVDWVYREFERIYHENPEICAIAIKSSEYNGVENKKRRESTHIEGGLIAFAGRNGLKCTSKIYASLGANSKTVKEIAENKFGKSSKYWDTKIADALLAADKESNC